MLLLGILLLTNPARIDSMDGQLRSDVSRNLLNLNGPVLTEYYTSLMYGPTNAKTGARYSFYGASPSLTPLPFMFASRAFGHSSLAADRFAFAFGGMFLSALVAPLILLLYRRLGCGLRQALPCLGIFCLATLWWPGSTSTYDQTQQAVVLLAAIFAAWEAGRTNRITLAVVAGLLCGLLLNYKEPYIIFFPAIALALFARPTEGIEPARLPIKRQPWLLLLIAAAGCALGIAGYHYYYWIRFDQTSMPRFESNQQTWGNPLSGFLTIFASPGKGLFWFSPPLFLCLWGVARLWRQAPRLMLAIAWCTAVFGTVVSNLACAGGDYCWGPRYMLLLMPLWALLLPFALQNRRAQRLAVPLVLVGFLVQLLALSIDHNRFFMANRLEGYFYERDPWFYFKKSQLLQRPAEVWESFIERNVERPKFSTSPIGDATHVPFRPSTEIITSEPMPDYSLLAKDSKKFFQLAKERADRAKEVVPDTRKWQEGYGVFYYPRPWWGWVHRVSKDQRPFEPAPMAIACALLTFAGCALLFSARRSKAPDLPVPNVPEFFDTPKEQVHA